MSGLDQQLVGLSRWCGLPPNLVLLGLTILAALILAVGLGLIWWQQQHKLGFTGTPFRKFLRGSRMVRSAQLSRQTRQRSELQISLAGIAMPVALESLHLLVGGSTGAGKSVLMRELVYSALQRGDRLIIVDPNADMLTQFGRPSDTILNPYDARSPGWSLFNEMRHDYDFSRLAFSVVPRGQSAEEEEWAGYGRLLLSETARQLFMTGPRTIQQLLYWTTAAEPADLKQFLQGTAAAALFVGADRALASARFVLSTRLAAQLPMPEGSFSLRNWLNAEAGNLFITWREDMAVSLRPLISTWVDVLCNAVLSLPESPQRRLWLILDELASLDKLTSLPDAATKGRKAGLRLVAGLQSTAQLDRIYGRDEAQSLRSCFRSLVVLGGAKTDPRTCEELSQSLGEHEVERALVARHSNAQGSQRHRHTQTVRERVVLASEIASLPPLSGYLALAGHYPMARIQLKITNFLRSSPAFVARSGESEA